MRPILPCLLGLLPLVLVDPLRAEPLTVDWFSAQLITPGVVPGTSIPAVLTPDSDPSGSYAGVRLTGTSTWLGHERLFQLEPFWHSEDLNWVGHFSSSPGGMASLEGYVPTEANRFGVEVTVTDPTSGQSGTGTYFPRWAYIGTVSQNGSALGVANYDPSLPPPPPPTLVVGGRSFTISLDAGQVNLDPFDGRVWVAVTGSDLPPSPDEPPPPDTETPQETPEPTTLVLAGLGMAGLLAQRRIARSSESE